MSCRCASVGALPRAVYENSCVDAVVEIWPETEIDIKEGSRHQLKVEGKHVSGWVTFTTKDGLGNFEIFSEGDGEGLPTIAEGDGETPAY